MKFKLFLLSLVLLFSMGICEAQSSFKRLPRPSPSYKKTLAALPDEKAITAFRFTGPIAGFMYPQNMVVTGLGYGFQRLHYVDSTDKYYTDFSISGVVYAGGNVRPSIHPNNIMSVGISLGVLNQVFMAGPCYNFPNGPVKGSIGVVFNISMPLNN